MLFGDLNTSKNQKCLSILFVSPKVNEGEIESDETRSI